MRALLAFAIPLLLVLTACSKDKEQCHSLSLAITEADNAFADLRAAAAHGKRAEFEKASKEFDAAATKIGAVEISGSSVRAEDYAGTQQRYVAAAPKIVPAYRRLLEAIEKDPKLGDKYHGGVPPLSAAGEVASDVEEAVNDVTVSGSSTRTMKCE